MIKFKHDGLQIFCWKTCLKRYDSANAPRWNLEIKPFVIQWVVQKEENMPMLWVVKDCMLLWIVAKKEGVVINLCLGFKKERMLTIMIETIMTQFSQ